MGRHVVLGAAGQMGRLLVPELQRRGHTVLALSRLGRARPHGGEVEHRAVDMLDSDSLTAATDGADVLYAVVGLPYAAQVWQRDWPPAMRNLISAAEANGCKLVFLDNVYAYGLVAGAMTEATAYNPCSRKREVRARIATELMEVDKTGRIVATIGRSADFYGPEAPPFDLRRALLQRRARQGSSRMAVQHQDAPYVQLHARQRPRSRHAGRGGCCERQGLAPPCGGGTSGRPTHRPRRRSRLSGNRSSRRVLSRRTIRLVSIFNAQLREIREVLTSRGGTPSPHPSSSTAAKGKRQPLLYTRDARARDASGERARESHRVHTSRGGTRPLTPARRPPLRRNASRFYTRVTRAREGIGERAWESPTVYTQAAGVPRPLTPAHRPPLTGNASRFYTRVTRARGEHRGSWVDGRAAASVSACSTSLAVSWIPRSRARPTDSNNSNTQSEFLPP